jgi:hypothetical protein
MNNSFRPRKFEDFEIINATGKVVGNLRVKPNSLLWAPLDAKVWYRVDIDDFARLAKKRNLRPKK